MKRFLIPAMIFVDAVDAAQADMDTSDMLIAFNQSREDHARIHTCIFSETVELEDGRQPEDLGEHPTRHVKAELERLKSQAAELTTQLQARTSEVRDLHHALSLLEEECSSNSYFATEHASELEAMENTSAVLARIPRPE